MPLQNIVDRLKRGASLPLDGAMGSERQRRGIDVLKGATAEGGLQAWSAMANIDAPEAVQQVHTGTTCERAPISSLATTSGRARCEWSRLGWATDGRRTPGLPERTPSRRARPLTRKHTSPAAWRLPAFNRRPKAKISKSPSWERKRFIRSLATTQSCWRRGGCGLVVARIGYIADCVAAVDACAETGLPVCLGVRHIQEDGSMQYEEQLEDLAAALEGHKIDAILLMCSSPEDILTALPRLKNAFDGPVGAYPNIGYYPLEPLKSEEAEGTPDEAAEFLQTSDNTPARLAAFAREWKAMGEQIIGCCCATGAEHIQAMHPEVKGWSCRGLPPG